MNPSFPTAGTIVVPRCDTVATAPKIRWGSAEFFVIAQTALPAVLYLPGTQPFRLYLRIAAFALSHTAGDPSSLADSIARLAADAPVRQRLGAAARAAAEQRFNTERMVSALIAVYEHVHPGALAGQPA